MNKRLFPVRLTQLASLWLVAGLLGSPGQAQTGAAAIRQADFIVAVVNSEPITNQEVQALSQRLSQDAAAQGIRTDAAVLKRQALDQLINEKAQLQQARESGIKIDEEALDQAELNVASSNQLTREALHKRLQQEGLTVAQYRAQLSKQLMLTRIREREVEARIRITDIEVEQFLQERLKAQAAQAASNAAELNLAMILIAVPENSTEAQIEPLAERARQIARRARSGESFEALAKAYSQAIDLGANGGVLGLRSTDRYPELFVNATQQLAVGTVSEPVRSGAGFHILKVIERRQAPATLVLTQTRARHILLRPGAQMSQDQALARLTQVRQDILSGRADFATVAARLSQDGSAQEGGDLGWASPGMFVPEFEQVMNRLQPGQLSEPLVSRFGIHLIEVTDRRNVPMSEADQRAMARNALREKKQDETYSAWVEDIRGRAYIEMREPPQ